MTNARIKELLGDLESELHMIEKSIEANKKIVLQYKRNIKTLEKMLANEERIEGENINE